MKQSNFPEGGLWLKGNLHSHSTVSDGFYAPEKLVALYAEKGYDFLSITDHNVYVHHNDLPEEEIILLTGVEHDIEYSPDKCAHFVGIGVVGKAQPDYECRRYSKQERTDQQIVDMMHKDGQFVTLAHPVWSRMHPEEVLALDGLSAIEVYNNGTEHLCHGGNAEVYWDLLLQQGKRVFATASDDVHTPDDLFGGWVWVKSEARTAQAIMDALHAGYYYASSGPQIFDFSVEDGKASLSCSPCRSIHFVTYEPRGRSFFARGEPLTRAEFQLKGRKAYVRAVCIDAQGHSAWSQPIFF
ncbi:MAG: CehA/McbA family metallohydrolase [Angelakisella sp.]|nr:CehA/McbA family metallohydrolase [Angelakisella sp.]